MIGILVAGYGLGHALMPDGYSRGKRNRARWNKAACPRRSSCDSNRSCFAPRPRNTTPLLNKCPGIDIRGVHAVLLVLVIEGWFRSYCRRVLLSCKKEKSSEFRWLGFKPSLDEVGRFLFIICYSALRSVLL